MLLTGFFFFALQAGLASVLCKYLDMSTVFTEAGDVCLSILAECWKLPDEFREETMQVMFGELLFARFHLRLEEYLGAVSGLVGREGWVEGWEDADVLDYTLPVLKMAALLLIRSPIAKILPAMGRDRTVPVRGLRPLARRCLFRAVRILLVVFWL